MTLTTRQKERGLFALTAYSSSILILSFRSVFSSSISSTAYEQTKLRKVYQQISWRGQNKPFVLSSRHVKRGGQRERERKKTCGWLPLIVSIYRFPLWATGFLLPNLPQTKKESTNIQYRAIALHRFGVKLRFFLSLLRPSCLTKYQKILFRWPDS